MKRVLFLVFWLASALVQSATPIDGWYSSVFGGYAYIPNNINQASFGIQRTHALYHGGYDAGGSLGFMSHPLRYEGEITYLDASLRHYKVNGITISNVHGYSNAVLAMANVYYDFNGLIYSIKPFIGMGIGYAWVNARLNNLTVTPPNVFTSSDNVFAYQASTGLTYNFAENFALNVGYRYVITTKATHLGKVFQANLANAGVIYRFDGCRYK